MTTEINRVLLLVALIVATGVCTVEVSRNSAQADEPRTMTRVEAYSAARVEVAFDLVAAMPARVRVILPMAQKGDLLIPIGCGSLAADAQGECMDVAYEMDSTPSVVVETREGSTTTLLKLNPITLAGASSEMSTPSE